jgi:hypothetical protein
MGKFPDISDYDTLLQQATGAVKHDEGKAPVVRGLLQYFPNALRAVSDVSGYGYEKYKSWGGWLDVPDARARYTDALGRHLLAEFGGQDFDEESDCLHAAHAAWNALARLELILRNR